ECIFRVLIGNNMTRRYESALLAALTVIITPAFAGDGANAPAIVTRYCSGCHGADGNSQLPYIPRLAGLSTAYSARKLATFRTAASSPVDETFSRFAHKKGTGDDRFTATAVAHMVGVANAVSDADMKAALAWYAG